MYIYTHTAEGGLIITLVVKADVDEGSGTVQRKTFD